MKKLILISSLLAAGTMMANAATITIDDLSKNASNATETATATISYDAATGYVSGTELFDGVYNESTKKVTTNYAATTTFNLDLTAIGVTSASTTTLSAFSTAVQLIDYKTSSSTSTNEIGLQITSTGLQFTWNGGNSWGDPASESAILSWANLWANSYAVGNSRYVTLSFESSRSYANTIDGIDNKNNNSTTPAIANSTFLYQLAEDATTVATDDFTIVADGFGYSSLTAAQQYTTIYLNKNYIENVSISSGVLNQEGILSVASSLKVIPEPSMFGLLAGTLALGLAGTRRRRSNK